MTGASAGQRKLLYRPVVEWSRETRLQRRTATLALRRPTGYYSREEEHGSAGPARRDREYIGSVLRRPEATCEPLRRRRSRYLR